MQSVVPNMSDFVYEVRHANRYKSVSEQTCRTLIKIVQEGVLDPTIGPITAFDVLSDFRIRKPVNDPLAFDALMAMAKLVGPAGASGRREDALHALGHAEYGAEMDSDKLSSEQLARLHKAKVEIIPFAMMEMTRDRGVLAGRDASKMAIAIVHAAPDQKALVFKTLLDVAEGQLRWNVYDIRDVAETVAANADPDSIEQKRALKMLHDEIAGTKDIFVANVLIRNYITAPRPVLQSFGQHELMLQRQRDKSPAGEIRQRVSENLAFLRTPDREIETLSILRDCALNLLKDFEEPALKSDDIFFRLQATNEFDRRVNTVYPKLVVEAIQDSLIPELVERGANSIDDLRQGLQALAERPALAEWATKELDELKQPNATFRHMGQTRVGKVLLTILQIEPNLSSLAHQSELLRAHLPSISKFEPPRLAHP